MASGDARRASLAENAPTQTKDTADDFALRPAGPNDAAALATHVIPDWHGRGVAEALMLDALQRAREVCGDLQEDPVVAQHP